MRMSIRSDRDLISGSGESEGEGDKRSGGMGSPMKRLVRWVLFGTQAQAIILSLLYRRLFFHVHNDKTFDILFTFMGMHGVPYEATSVLRLIDIVSSRACYQLRASVE